MGVVITNARVKGCDVCGADGVDAHWIRIENPKVILCNPDVIKICTPCLIKFRDKIIEYLKLKGIDDKDIALEDLSSAEEEVVKEFLSSSEVCI